MTEPEDYINVKGRDETGPPKQEALDNEEIEEKRESLAILASSTIKDFVGVEMSLGDIRKLKIKDVKKYYNRYQAVLGRQATSFPVSSSINLASREISFLLSIDDPNTLSSDLEKDELVKRELSNVFGQLAFIGGRIVALGSALLCIAKHVKMDLFGKNEQENVVVPEEDDLHTRNIRSKEK